MLRSILVFFFLQLAVWSIVFYENDQSSLSFHKSAISATWVNDSRNLGLEPIWNHLTLLENGQYIRKSGAIMEYGQWNISKSGDRLMFYSNEGRKEFLILQFPTEPTDKLVIKPLDLASYQESRPPEFTLVRQDL